MTQGCDFYCTSIPLTKALSLTVVNVIEYWLLLFVFDYELLDDELLDDRLVFGPATAKVSL